MPPTMPKTSAVIATSGHRQREGRLTSWVSSKGASGPDSAACFGARGTIAPGGGGTTGNGVVAGGGGGHCCSEGVYDAAGSPAAGGCVGAPAAGTCADAPAAGTCG